MDIYAQNILDHYKNPRNFGEIKDANASHAEANYACGDKLKVDIKTKGQKIVDIKFQGSGCAISQAAMSILTEAIIGKTKKEILKLTQADIKNLLGVTISARREKCSALALMTVQNALRKK